MYYRIIIGEGPSADNWLLEKDNYSPGTISRLTQIGEGINQLPDVLPNFLMMNLISDRFFKAIGDDPLLRNYIEDASRIICLANDTSFTYYHVPVSRIEDLLDHPRLEMAMVNKNKNSKDLYSAIWKISLLRDAPVDIHFFRPKGFTKATIVSSKVKDLYDTHRFTGLSFIEC